MANISSLLTHFESHKKSYPMLYKSNPRGMRLRLAINFSLSVLDLKT